MAHVEYEYLNISSKYMDVSDQPHSDQYNIHSYFIGGGYRQPLGKKLNMHILVLWNLNDNLYSPYSNPIIRIGIGG